MVLVLLFFLLEFFDPLMRENELMLECLDLRDVDGFEVRIYPRFSRHCLY